MKAIDFHIHTIPETGKDYSFTFSQHWLNEYIAKTSLDAIAICNHNLFDGNQFSQISAATSDCTVFPGMELSLAEGHVIVVYDNDEDSILEVAHASDRIGSLNLGPSDGITIEQFKEYFPSWKNSVLVFEISKSNSMVIPQELRQATCMGGVSSPNRFLRELTAGAELPALFSDAHASVDETNPRRNDIAKLAQKHTFVECDTTDFSDIRRALHSRKTIGVNRELMNDVYDVVVDDHALRVSTGLNLIVGRRGSGKTFLIQSIEDDSKDGVYRLAQFDTASNRKEFLEKQQSRKGEQARREFTQKYSTTWAKINEILMSPDATPDLNKYLQELSKYGSEFNSRGQASKITLFNEREYELLSQKNLKQQLNHLADFLNNKEVWKHISVDYRKTFLMAYHDLREYLVADYIASEQKKRVNQLLSQVIAEIKRQSGVREPPRINFTAVFLHELVAKKTNHFLQELVYRHSDGIVLKKERFGEYQVVVRFVPFHDAKEYQSIVHTRDAVKSQLLNPYAKGDFVTYLDHLRQCDFFKPDHLPEYIAQVQTKLETAQGNPASGGQEVAFALLMGLEEAKHAEIALIDEPEASLDNYFIRTTLIPKLRELAEHTTTFVITHNSTLGTLLAPNYLIVAKTKDEKTYEYLSGDFKSAKIRTTQGQEFDSVGDFVDAMESGMETYEKKGEIYGSLQN